ncbi:DUF559 domain-containing protein [archaeon]|nr:MAG: DUF559 domain-containing protein [archaeon]
MFLAVPTSIEIKMLEELRKRKIGFKYQYKVMDGVVADFAFPRSRLIVECDGDYWHVNPKKYKKLSRYQKMKRLEDKERQELIEMAGWKVLRFWENEINRDVTSVVNKIEKSLKL